MVIRTYVLTIDYRRVRGAVKLCNITYDTFMIMNVQVREDVGLI